MHPEPENIDKFKCEERGCGSKFHSKALLTAHHQKKHVIVKCKDSSCSFRGTKNNVSLHFAAIHLKLHLCGACGLLLSTERRLNHHESIFHNNDFPGKIDPGHLVNCNQCLLEFSNDSLKRAHECAGFNASCNRAAIIRRFNVKKLASMTRPIADYTEGQSSPIKKSPAPRKGDGFVVL
jgi:hypothetical protein